MEVFAPARRDGRPDPPPDSRVLNETAPPPHLRRRDSAIHTRNRSRAKTPLVDQLASDLTTMAEERSSIRSLAAKEIERVIQILARRTKNNPASSANRVSARPPSWKDLPANCRRRCPRSADEQARAAARRSSLVAGTCTRPVRRTTQTRHR